jgi:hypothetical protein
MRIQGYFASFGAPCVPVIVQRRGSDRSESFPFIIDTGASRSMLGTRVIYRLGISIHELRKSVETKVVFGGRAQFYLLQDVDLVFKTDHGPHTEFLPAILTSFSPYTGVHRKRPHVHSILGRDILDRYALILDRRAGLVMLTDESLVSRSEGTPVLEAPISEEA